MGKKHRVALTASVLALTLAAALMLAWTIPWRQTYLRGDMNQDELINHSSVTLPDETWSLSISVPLIYAGEVCLETESAEGAELTVSAGDSMATLTVAPGSQSLRAPLDVWNTTIDIFCESETSVTIVKLWVDNAAVVNLPLLILLTAGALTLSWLTWTMSAPRIRLHWVCFGVLLLAGLALVALKPAHLYWSWDEETHRNHALALAGVGIDNAATWLQWQSNWCMGYWPNALGIALAGLLGLGDTAQWLLGQASSVVVYAALCALAVRVTPRCKLTFAMIAAMPTCLFLATSYSYDPIVIACVLLGMAMVLRELEEPERPLTGVRAVLMVSVLALGTLPKPAYSLLLPLAWLLPAGKFGGRRRQWVFRLFVLAVMALCLLSLVLPGPYDDLRGGDSRFENADAAAQLAYMGENPLTFLRTLGGYLLRNGLRLYYGELCSFAYLGSAPGAFWLAAALLLLAPLYSADERPGSALSPGRRGWLAILSALPLLTLAATQYVVSTGVGSATVRGMQSRYGLPVLILAALALMLPEKLRRRTQGLSRWTALVCLAAMAGISLGMIFRLILQGIMGLCC